MMDKPLCQEETRGPSSIASHRFCYHFLIVFTLLGKVRSIAIKNMGIFGIYVYVLEEVIKHVPMITLRMVFWNSNIFIHVEGDDIFERYLASFVGLYKLLIHFQWSSSCRQSQNKHLIWARIESINSLDDIFGSPLSHFFSFVSDN